MQRATAEIVCFDCFYSFSIISPPETSQPVFFSHPLAVCVSCMDKQIKNKALGPHHTDIQWVEKDIDSERDGQ